MSSGEGGGIDEASRAASKAVSVIPGVAGDSAFGDTATGDEIPRCARGDKVSMPKVVFPLRSCADRLPLDLSPRKAGGLLGVSHGLG